MQWPILKMYQNESHGLKSQVETSTELVSLDGGLSEEAFALQPGIKIDNQENDFVLWFFARPSTGRWQHCSIQFTEDSFILTGGAFTEARVTEYSGTADHNGSENNNFEIHTDLDREEVTTR